MAALDFPASPSDGATYSPSGSNITYVFSTTKGSWQGQIGTVSSSLKLDDIGTGDAASNLVTTAGDITIDAQGSDTDIIFKGNDGGSTITALTIDMSDNGLLQVGGSARFGAGHLDFADTYKARFGNSDDLQLWHGGGAEGHNSFIDGTSNDLFIQCGGEIAITNTGGNSATTAKMASFNQGGAVQLYHNTNEKFATTSAGIDVTGTVTSSGDIIADGNGSSGGITLSDGLISIRTGTGSVAAIDLYCESSNAHKVTIQSPAHADYSGDVTLTLPTTSGTITSTGKQTMWIPAAAMYPREDNGCAALAQVDIGTNNPDLKVLDFDPSSDEFAEFSVAFPKSWNAGTVTFQAYFVVTGSNTGTVKWELEGLSVGDGDKLTTLSYSSPVGPAAKAHDGSTNDLNITAESGAVTIANAAAGELTYFRLRRDVSDDTQTGDARLVGIKLFFTTDKANDE
tara:strand:- start:625 stop:1989 length:1365 start_codon:yes stop_codon:yes gene_type:complete